MSCHSKRVSCHSKKFREHMVEFAIKLSSTIVFTKLLKVVKK